MARDPLEVDQERPQQLGILGDAGGDAAADRPGQLVGAGEDPAVHGAAAADDDPWPRQGGGAWPWSLSHATPVTGRVRKASTTRMQNSIDRVIMHSDDQTVPMRC